MAGDQGGYASPIIGGLGALIRDWIRSRNYDPGPPIVGWQISANGDASFGGNVTIQGDLRTGPPAPYVEILNGDGGINFYTTLAGETDPARIDTTGGTLTFRSAEGPTTPDAGILRETSGNTSIGGTSRAGLGFSGDILAAGEVSGDATPYATASDSSSRTTASTAYTTIAGQTLNITMACPKSKRLLIHGWALIANSVAAQGGLMSFEVRESNAAGPLSSAATDIGAARSPGVDFASAAAVRYVDLGAAFPGTSNVFIRALYRSTNAANTANFGQGLLTVIPVL